MQGNILVMVAHGKAMLTDATVRTLARHLHPDTTASVVKSSIYQAPEYLRPDEFVPPTQATDVYALASTIFAVGYSLIEFQYKEAIDIC